MGAFIMDFEQRAARIRYLTGIQFLGLGHNPDWREQEYSEFVLRLGKPIKTARPSEGGGPENLDLIVIADATIQICRTQQKFTRQLRGQLGAVFNDYQSPDHLYNAAVVLDMVREECPSLVHDLAPKLGSAVQSVPVFKPDVGRYHDLITIFSKVCAQTGYHKTALKILVPLLEETKGIEDGVVFAQFQHHMGVKDTAMLTRVADAFGLRAQQEEQSGNTDHAQSWRTRQRAIRTQISGLDAAA